MLTSTPFLLFDGDCADAMTFYHAAFGGDLTLTPLADTPMKDQFPAEKHSRIINARLVADAVDISATDWMASPALDPIRGNMSAVYLTSDDDTRLREIFDHLRDGADTERLQELHTMPFGLYGQLYDRYGVQWVFVGSEG